ncbi:hypothetical protein LTS15_000134 [Exophiala xenobiotica]|nr:hypothetical protein LTS15_000134 [Exophiala xenobiotica]
MRPLWSEGDTGAVRSGGMAAGDSFTRREQSIENVWFRQHEIENIKQMRQKLNAQKKQLADFETHLDEMEKAAEERKDAAGQEQ